jgi:glycine/D-amino acid oxidase-like deaminating enzyme
MPASPSTDVVIIGAGLAGLVAAAELVDAGKRVTILDQEPEASFGGQAWWSFGGIFLVDSPEQRHLGVHDSLELARQDWFASGGGEPVLPGSIETKTPGRGSGPRPTSISRPGRNALGFTSRA